MVVKMHNIWMIKIGKELHLPDKDLLAVGVIHLKGFDSNTALLFETIFCKIDFTKSSFSDQSNYPIFPI